jgi:23S rRNA (guanosine2251-2'-O)-methyltransferase
MKNFKTKNSSQGGRKPFNRSFGYANARAFTPKRVQATTTTTSSEKTMNIYGKNVVYEAILNKPQCIEKVFTEKEKFGDNKILDLIKKHNFKTEQFDKENLPRELQNINHQGVFAKIDFTKIVVDYKTFINNLEINPKTALVILGELEDVQNIGGIIRSSAAFNVSGILIPEHRQAQISESIIKISSGQVFNIPLVSIKNVNEAIRDLKKKTFWVYGLDMQGDKFVHEEKFAEPSVFVVGSEGKGMRQKTEENCDITLKIPMSPKCESLNAATSMSVVLYEWYKQNI